MRPHLVRLNSTITSQAQAVFNIILIFELSIILIILIGAPLLCSIHRNFRWQIYLAVAMYFISIATRFVLIYYQLWDVPLTDTDPLLLTAELLRDIAIGYYSGLACSMVLQTLVGTYYWQWYEKGSASTSLVLLFSESGNILFATINATIWLLGLAMKKLVDPAERPVQIGSFSGYTDFFYNILYQFIASSLGATGFVFTYRKNARALKEMTKDRISYGNYTVDRSFQVRENVLQMKYVVQSIVPAALISSPCFICFGFNEYGPADWKLSRGIAYALWDLVFAGFRIVYLYLQIKNHPQIYKEFMNLGMILWFMRRRRMRKNTISNESVASNPDYEATQSYFNQLNKAWA